MTEQDIEMLEGDPVAMRVMALGFLFDWLGSSEFKNPASTRELLNCPELQRFKPESRYDRATARVQKLVLDWLRRESLIRFREGGRPGRQRSKDYGGEELARANRVVNGSLIGLHAESTLKRYRTVLGEYSTHPLVKVWTVPNAVFGLFEECFGLPNDCSATDFAQKNNLPAKLVKAWARELLAEGRVVEKKVQGKRLLRRVAGVES
jgi:hypothetical protein